jgi:hypothetical protein
MGIETTMRRGSVAAVDRACKEKTRQGVRFRATRGYVVWQDEAGLGCCKLDDLSDNVLQLSSDDLEGEGARKEV